MRFLLVVRWHPESVPGCDASVICRRPSEYRRRWMLRRAEPRLAAPEQGRSRHRCKPLRTLPPPYLRWATYGASQQELQREHMVHDARAESDRMEWCAFEDLQLLLQRYNGPVEARTVGTPPVHWYRPP